MPKKSVKRGGGDQGINDPLYVFGSAAVALVLIVSYFVK